MNTLPLFPLNAHIFPGGKLRLRIFEPRYVRMVKAQIAQDPAFIMGLLSSADKTKVLSTGTLVRVIDFERLEDGLLGITIEGLSCASITVSHVEDDGLRIASYEPVPNWSGSNIDSELSHQWCYLRNEIKELQELYVDVDDKDPEWFLLRWLEILPLSNEKKLELVQQDNSEIAFTFVEKMLEGADPV